MVIGRSGRGSEGRKKREGEEWEWVMHEERGSVKVRVEEREKGGIMKGGDLTRNIPSLLKTFTGPPRLKQQ